MTAPPAPATRGAGERWSADPYVRALRSGRGPLFLHRGDGWLLPLAVERWCAPPDAADRTVLARCRGSVLDIGCGPGRLVAALAGRNVRALGIDVTAEAVLRATRAGGPALLRSVFDPLPDEGRWDTALLVDGNIGIGGDPTSLLRRTAAVVRPSGTLIVEAAPSSPDGGGTDRETDRETALGTGHADGTAYGFGVVDGFDDTVDGLDEVVDVRLGDGSGPHGEAFPWARVGPGALLRHAERAGLAPSAAWACGARRFIALRRRDPRDAASG